ncbi:MAG: 3',5'-cyclic-nucleotide phosphodiesterase [Limnobacter sp.]|nr:3',5'-cyclic-nucleotide phosphodiesterase [Limnobacter sp.]
MSTHFSKIEVLGCSGGIGVIGEGTTCFLVDEDVLIDAGTGMLRLPLERLEKIRHVIVTHSHLDHICGIPLMIDSVSRANSEPLQIHALPETIQALRDHMFNGVIWPDFSRIPSIEKPAIQYVELDCQDEQPHAFKIGERLFTAIPVHHSVPSIGLTVETPTGAWAFSGDTHKTEEFYKIINLMKGMRHVLVEAAFPDHELWLADLSLHLCPSLLAIELEKLIPQAEVWITHLKPNEKALIEKEIKSYCDPDGLKPTIQQALGFLKTGQVFEV